jgi:phage baseplate assembly protein W
MINLQKYGIKFPITVISDEKSLFDTNFLLSDAVNSEIFHVIFTPKGQRLRDPEFGTNLIKFIFDPNDMQTWDGVVSEVKEAITRYVPNCKLNDINVLEGDDGSGLYVSIEYSVWNNGVVSTYKTVTKIA